VNGIVFPHNYSLCNPLGGIRSSEAVPVLAPDFLLIGGSHWKSVQFPGSSPRLSQIAGLSGFPTKFRLNSHYFSGQSSKQPNSELGGSWKNFRGSISIVNCLNFRFMALSARSGKSGTTKKQNTFVWSGF